MAIRSKHSTNHELAQPDMTTLSLLESHAFEAQWRLSCTPQNCELPGEVRWVPRNGGRAQVRLLVHGELLTAPESSKAWTLHGVTTTGEQLTLLKAAAVPAHQPLLGDALEQEFINSWLVVGAHLDEESAFTSMRFSVPGLKHWLQPRGDKAASIDPTSIEPIAVTTVALPDTDASLTLSIQRTRIQYDGLDMSISSDGVLELVSPQPRSFHWFVEQLRVVTTFIALASGSPAGPSMIMATLAGSAAPVCILAALNDAQCSTIKHSWECFLPSDALGLPLEAVIAQWYRRWPPLMMQSLHALAMMTRADLMAHLEFLMVSDGLEGLHRALGLEVRFVPKAQYKPLLEQISAEIAKTVGDEALRGAMIKKLEYANQLDMYERIVALVARLPDEFRRLLIGPGDEVPRIWGRTRNYYTHWDESSKKKILDGAGMRCASHRMKLLMRSVLLMEAGVTSDAIATGLRQPLHQDGQWLSKLNDEERSSPLSDDR